MASIRREISIAVPAEQAWSALRDVGALHTRLVAGFVTDCRLEGDTRVVSFANGRVARELIVDVSDTEHRVVWSSIGGHLSRRSEAPLKLGSEGGSKSGLLCTAAQVLRSGLTHHNASAQVFDDGAGGSRVVWIADLLPNELAPAIAAMIEQGTLAMKTTLERAAQAA